MWNLAVKPGIKVSKATNSVVMKSFVTKWQWGETVKGIPDRAQWITISHFKHVLQN